MADNHIIIGLGGTGGNTIAAFKKLLFENKNGETTTSNHGVECIYVDSSSNDLKMKGKKWQAMGTDISLGQAQVLKIEAPQSILPYIQNSEAYPNLKYWVGQPSQWEDLLGDTDKQVQAGGQRRKLGRLNFALKANDFAQLVNDRVNILREKCTGGFQLKFHVCAGLAGGTGSGSVVDVCALLRKNYPESSINVYCVLPETNPSFNVTPFYHANGYAALLELNALGFGSFLPFDVSNKMQVRNEKIGGENGLANTAFNLCYLLADMNEEECPLSPNGNESNPIGSLIQNLAEYIFQTAVISNPQIIGAVHRAETMENPPELPNSNYGFSNKFYSFGYKRFAIPEQEIKEYFAYLFGYQSTLQFMYNNFNVAEGYTGTAISKSYHSIVSNNNFLQKFNLTRDHLILSKDVLGQYKDSIKDNSIESLFIETMNTISGTIKQGNSMDGRKIDKDHWLDAILTWGNKFFDNNFRQVGQIGGVYSFYDTKTLDKDNLSKKITENIEKEFFNDWNAGIISLEEIVETLRALKLYLISEKQKFNSEISQNTLTIKTIESALVSINKDWRTGFIRSFFNDNEGKVKDTQKNVTDLLILRTRSKGFVYAQELIDSITPKIDNLISNVSSVNGYFNEIKETFKNEHLSRCKENEAPDKNSVLIKYYEPKLIKEFAGVLVKNKNILNDRISALRQLVYNIALDSSSYFERLKKINIEEIRNILEVESLELTKTFFNTPNIVAQISDNNLINQNILQKLKEETSGNDKLLEEKLTLLVNQAALTSKFDASQVNDAFSSLDERATMVILPENIGDDDFTNKVIDIFRTIRIRCEIGIGGNPNEILIFNVKRGAQVREFLNVSKLKTAYDSLMDSSGVRAKFVCHTEDFEILHEKPSTERMSSYINENKQKSLVYSLFPPTEREKQESILNAQNNAIPYLLLGKACGTVLDAEHPETGRKVICLMKNTVFGDEPIILGNTLSESIEKLDAETSHLLVTQTEQRLKEQFRHISTHDELILKIKDQIVTIQNDFGNNPLNPTVKRFRDSGSKSLKILENLN